MNMRFVGVVNNWMHQKCILCNADLQYNFVVIPKCIRYIAPMNFAITPSLEQLIVCIGLHSDVAWLHLQFRL